jgi:O-antigen/teichoic acid export membrane protein
MFGRDRPTTIASKRVQRVARESVWIATGQGAAVVGSLVGVRILTELMSPSEYGQLALGMTLATLVTQTLFGPLSQGAARFYSPAREINGLRGYLEAVRRFGIWASAIVLIVAAIGTVVAVAFGARVWVTLVGAAFAFAVLSGVNSVMSGIQNAARQRAIVAFHAAMAAWGRFSIAAVLMIAVGVSSTVALLGYAIATAAVLGSQYMFFRPVVRASHDEPSDRAPIEQGWHHRLVEYSWPFATWGVFSTLQLVSDRWALEVFSSSSDVGAFAVLYQLGYYPMTMLSGLMVALVAPILYQRAGDAGSVERLNQAGKLNQQILLIVIAGTLVAFAIALAADELIFRIFVASEYAGFAHLLPWLILSGGIFAGGQVVSLNRMSRLETRALIAPKIATALLGVAFNVLGAFYFGLPGVVAASLAFSGVYFIWMFLTARHR